MYVHICRYTPFTFMWPHIIYLCTYKYLQMSHPKNVRCTLYIIICTSYTWHLLYIIAGKSFCPEARWKRISTVFPRDFQTNCEYFRCNYLVRWIMTAPDLFKGLVIKMISPNKIKRCTYAAIWKSKVRLLRIFQAYGTAPPNHALSGSMSLLKNKGLAKSLLLQKIF